MNKIVEKILFWNLPIFRKMAWWQECLLVINGFCWGFGVTIPGIVFLWLMFKLSIG